MRYAIHNAISFSTTDQKWVVRFDSSEERWHEPVVGFAVVISHPGGDVSHTETDIVPVVLDDGILVTVHDYVENRDSVRYRGMYDAASVPE